MKPLKTTLAALSILCANALGQTSNTSPTADYLLDLSWKDLKFTNVMALAENAAVEVRGIDAASSASSLWYYLSARDGTALAITTNVVASTNANAAIGYLNLATTNLQAQFAGANPIAEKNFVFSVWDTARDVLLASALVGVKNNPMANGLISGWTNLPASLTNEFSASVLAALDAAWNAQFVASNAYALAYGIATTNEPLWTAASNSVLYVGDIAETAYGTETNTAYRGDWGASVSNLAAQAAGWGDHAAAGYLTAESDTAALAAVAGVESNVTALAETVGGITAESLGALTAEEAEVLLAAATNIVVESVGGPLLEDFATAEFRVSGSGWGVAATGEAVNHGNVIARENTLGLRENFTIAFTNIRSSVEGVSPTATAGANLSDGPFSAGAWDMAGNTATGLHWSAGVQSGDVGIVECTIGSWTGQASRTFPGYTATANVHEFLGFVPGSLRATVDADMLARNATGDINPFETTTTWPNLIRNTNVWTKDMDLTCVSPYAQAGFLFR